MQYRQRGVERGGEGGGEGGRFDCDPYRSGLEAAPLNLISLKRLKGRGVRRKSNGQITGSSSQRIISQKK